MEVIPLMHIPLAGPFAMASMIGHESMNFFASQTVFCDGSRMSPKGHMEATKSLSNKATEVFLRQKRQEVGRGLRLCVDQYGVRMDAETLPDEVHSVNKLTVIASEGYASFVADLQKDIKADLYDRPTKADIDFFIGKILFSNEGKKYTVSKEDAQEIVFQLRMNGYITKSGCAT